MWVWVCREGGGPPAADGTQLAQHTTPHHTRVVTASLPTACLCCPPVCTVCNAMCRFEAAWGWALQQLGLPQSRCRHLSAVLAVPIDMTAAEVSSVSRESIQ